MVSTSAARARKRSRASPTPTGEERAKAAASPCHPRAAEVDTINYGAYRHEVFAQLGGFDETMTNVEDDEFNYRLRAAGGRLFLTPAIRCDYEARTGIIALIRQYARYGYPKIRVLRRHPRQMRARRRFPGAFSSPDAMRRRASP